jgi:NTE family protein
LICRIKADEKFNWLDFFMDDKKKVALFNMGAQKALEFLETFDWQNYKDFRATLIDGGE